MTTDSGLAVSGQRRAQASARRRLSGALLGLLREFPLIPVLALAVVIGALINPNFLTPQNIVHNIFEQNAPIAIIVVGEALLLIAAKIDLSVESTTGLVPLVGGWLVVPAIEHGSGVNAGPLAAILAMVVLAIAIGGLNGFLIVRLRLNPFILTLAMLILLRGSATGLTNGTSMSDLPDALTYLGSAQWLDIPASVWIAGALVLSADFLMGHHRIGRAVYAIGGNAEAARAAGIRVERITFGLFVLASLLAALAGFFVMGRIGSVSTGQGQNWIFAVMAGTVLGGVDLNGGRGRILGALTGVILLGCVNNILIIAQVPVFWLDTTNGALIVIALALSEVVKRRGLLARSITGSRGGRSRRAPADLSTAAAESTAHS